MADLRFPVMADISYDPGVCQPKRGNEFPHRSAIKHSLKFEKRKAALQRAVEFEVVPGLLKAHRSQAAAPAELAQRSSDAARVLADLVLGKNAGQATAHIESLREQNLPLEDIYLRFIEPAATCLNQMWPDDRCDFAAVTLGLWRLQQLLREFSVAFREAAPYPTGRALLTLGATPTHEMPYQMFRLVLAGEFFRRDGWDTWIEPDGNSAEILTLLQTESFDVLEITINNDRRLDTLAARLRTMRGESLNSSLCIAIGGPVARDHPDLVEILGGDVLAAELNNAAARSRYLPRTADFRNR